MPLSPYHAGKGMDWPCRQSRISTRRECDGEGLPAGARGGRGYLERAGSLGAVRGLRIKAPTHRSGHVPSCPTFPIEKVGNGLDRPRTYHPQDCGALAPSPPPAYYDRT